MAASISVAAQSDDDETPDFSSLNLDGRWVYATEWYNVSRCQLTGSMKIDWVAEREDYDCFQIARFQCVHSGVDYTAKQTCTINHDGDTVTVDSEIESLIPDSPGYMPDNFDLEIVHPGLMTGLLRSANIAPVTFRRQIEEIS